MTIKQTIFGLALAVSLAPLPVLAVSDNAQGNSQNNTSVSTGNNSSARGSADAVKNCANVQNRIAAQQKKYSSAKQSHSQSYDNMLSRLNRFSANIKAKGYDTATLDTDIATLASKVAEFKAMTATSAQIMTQSANGACAAGSNQELKDSMAQIRNKVRIAHQKAAEIRSFYQTVVREDLKELKNQYPRAVSNTTTNTADETAE